MKKITLALLFASLPSLAPAAIDLTPRYMDTVADGMVLHRLYFSDGGKKILISLNAETEVAPDSKGVRFRFTKLPKSVFRVIPSPHTPAEVFTSAGSERYRETLKSLLPLRAQNVAIREEVLDPLPINDWRSYRMLVACEVGTERYLQSVTFLNLNAADQIVLITTAPEQEFNDAADRSFQIIRTWQPMLPSDVKTAGGN